MKGNIIIKNAAELVTCSGFVPKAGKEMSDLKVVKKGTVVIEDGIITAVGKTADVIKDLDETEYMVINAENNAVLPGFVDSHTHFVFGGYRPSEFCQRIQGASYIDILESGGGILSTVNATREASKEELIVSGKKRLDSMLSFGVTTVEGKSGYGLDHDTEIKQLEVMNVLDQNHPVDIAKTFLGAHAVLPEYKGKEEVFIDFLIDQVLPEVVERNLAEFCDIFCEDKVFSIDLSRKLLTKAKELGLKLKFHADEIVQLGGAELAADLKAVSADHLLQVSDQGIQKMAKTGVVATLLPGTAFSLKEPYARGREMIDKGCIVALSTDFNPGSCFSESVPLIMGLAALYMNLSVEETVTAMTINGAAALGREKTIGSLDKGKIGDVIILEYPSYKFIPYHLGVNSVEKVIKNGKLVFDKHK